jgi:hypothetical protein
MKKIANGEILQQNVVQWMAGKNRLLDIEDLANIETREVKKRFRRVYTKGQVLEGGAVIPLNI